MFAVCVPFAMLPHLANSFTSVQSLFSPSIVILISFAFCARMNVRLPMSFWGVSTIEVYTRMLFFSTSSVVSLVSMLVASTIGSIRSATQSCFMLFHYVLEDI